MPLGVVREKCGREDVSQGIAFNLVAEFIYRVLDCIAWLHSKFRLACSARCELPLRRLPPFRLGVKYLVEKSDQFDISACQW